MESPSPSPVLATVVPSPGGTRSTYLPLHQEASLLDDLGIISSISGSYEQLPSQETEPYSPFHLNYWVRMLLEVWLLFVMAVCICLGGVFLLLLLLFIYEVIMARAFHQPLDYGSQRELLFPALKYFPQTAVSLGSVYGIYRYYRKDYRIAIFISFVPLLLLWYT